MDEFYGRNMPDAPWDETQFVGLSQLYAKSARIFDEDGVEFFERGSVSWSETNVVQATARRRGARAYYLLDERALAERVRERTVAELVDAAPAEALVPIEDLPFAAPPGVVAAVRVIASITHTIGGIRVDDRARVLGEDGSPLGGLWAAGVDAGGVSTGGYASGLAQALVLGLAAAEDAAATPLGPDGERAGARVAGEGRDADLVDLQRQPVLVPAVADLGQVAVHLPQRVARGRPDEEHVAVAVAHRRGS